uniref:Uncharacterized protein n=1 Tax=Ananas comosus var. bracteatus TaxID=296719 RepID=A0A6V7NLC5_ANACO|nr:unnamed protein product [Ananas comosus var. bracteatus]
MESWMEVLPPAATDPFLCSTDKWEKVAAAIPGKTVGDVVSHYRNLVADVRQIEAGLVPFPGYNSSAPPFTLEWEKQPYSSCLLGVGGRRSSSSSSSGRSSSDQERKKGVPWTEEEHRLFLMGLQKYGKGDWRSISRNFVMTRTPTQVASHAQKYFIRLNSGGKDKRRSSIHDITTVNLPDSRPQSPSQPSILGAKSNLAAPPPMPGHISPTIDANKQHHEAANNAFNSCAHTTNKYSMQPSFGASPYGTKLHPQISQCGPLNDSMVGDHSMLFQMQFSQPHSHG